MNQAGLFFAVASLPSPFIIPTIMLLGLLGLLPVQHKTRQRAFKTRYPTAELGIRPLLLTLPDGSSLVSHAAAGAIMCRQLFIFPGPVRDV
jgi:hypothetical protein